MKTHKLFLWEKSLQRNQNFITIIIDFSNKIETLENLDLKELDFVEIMVGVS